MTRSKRKAGLSNRSLKTNKQTKKASKLFSNGNALYQQRRLNEAAQCYRQALGFKPDYAEAYNNLATVCIEQGKKQEAITYYQQAVSNKPNYVDANLNLANIYYQDGCKEEAVELYQTVLKGEPNHPIANANLGVAYLNLQLPEAAAKYFRKTLQLTPNDSQLQNQLGIALQNQGKLDEAEIEFQKSIQLNSGNIMALNNLSIVLKTQGKLSEALACTESALTLEPNNPITLNNMAGIYASQGQPDKAIPYFRRSLEIKPDVSAHCNLLFAMALDADIDIATYQAECKHWVQTYAQPSINSIEPHPNVVEEHRKLRIGYVSSDFRNHAAVYIFGSMILKHNPEQFDVVCYYGVELQDEITEQLKSAATEWRSIVGLSDDALAEQIRADKIDILVDLSGHTSGNRLMVFARKPAPVQVTAWGDGTGTGLPTMDYLFSDAISIPAEEIDLYAEDIYYLPCRLSYMPLQSVPDVGELPAKRNGFITFGCLNNLRKLSDETLSLWAAIMNEVPESRLLLKDRSLNDETMRQRLLAKLTSHGIDNERVSLVGGTSRYEHLNTCNQIDIALDPFPYGGGTTTLDTLWMGIPLVALLGKTSVGRVAAAILNAAGLKQFIARNKDEYKDIAIRVASDVNELEFLRQGMRERLTATPVFNATDYVELVEKAYRDMWQQWCAQRANAPHHIEQLLDTNTNIEKAQECFNNGNAFYGQGRHADAAQSYLQALSYKPDYAEAFNNLATVYSEQNKKQEAITYYLQAIFNKPDYVDANFNLANVYYTQGRTAEAVELYEKVLKLQPDHLHANTNIGVAYLNLNKPEVAAAFFEKSLKLAPNDTQIDNQLGVALQAQGKLEEATGVFQKSIKTNPDNTLALNNLAMALKTQGKVSEAMAYLEQAISVNANDPETLKNLAGLYAAQGKPDEAIPYFRQSLALQPDNELTHCNLLFAMALDADIDVASYQAECQYWAEQHAARFTRCIKSHSNLAEGNRKLRIGYISADFRKHAAVYIFGPMILQYNPELFDVVCYSCSEYEDEITAQLKPLATIWRSVTRMSDDELAEQIRADDIDILVDLSGHTSGNKLMVFARKPAPVQVTAWGDGTGTGLPTMDYLFSDELSVPAEEVNLYAEAIYYLPCRLTYMPLQGAPDIGALPANNNGFITFGCLNALRKLSDETLALWASIMHEIPNSRLLLKDRTLDDKVLQQNLLNRLNTHAIDNERVILLGGTPRQQHLAACNQIDIALDPFPYGGGTTTLDTLWMGVPLIALHGHTSVGRVAASILNAVGLTQFIAKDKQEYKTLAINAASDLSKLASLRLNMREQLLTTPVFSSEQYVRLVEDAYHHMWQQWCDNVKQLSNCV